MKKNYQNSKHFVSSYNFIYFVEIIDEKLVVSESNKILWNIIINIDNPVKFKWKLFIDPYKLLDNITTVRALFTVFKNRWVILSPKFEKNESI